MAGYSLASSTQTVDLGETLRSSFYGLVSSPQIFTSEERRILLPKRYPHWAIADGDAVAGQLELHFACFHENWSIGLRYAIKGRVG